MADGQTSKDELSFVVSNANTTKLGLTQHDWLKTLALLLMLVDHLGFFVFMQEPWLRVIGRGAAPIWLFLLGYSLSRKLDAWLWIYGLALIAVWGSLGLPFGALNILWTIIITRLFMQLWLKYDGQLNWRIGLWLLGLATLIQPTNDIFEYGTLGPIFALSGYYVRQKPQQISGALILAFALSAHFWLAEQVFAFKDAHLYGLLLFLGIIGLVLYNFKAGEWQVKMTQSLYGLFKMGGRYSVHFYFWHQMPLLLLLFYTFKL